MSNPNITEIITKIILRNDVYEAWQVSTIILEKGEPAVVFDPSTLTAKLKIGNGKLTFSELPFSTVTPAEVQEMISQYMTGGGEIKSVTLQSGSNNGTLKLVVNGVEYDNIAVTGLGTAAFADISEFATTSQGERADNAMTFKGVVSSLSEIPEDLSKGDTYKAGNVFSIPVDKSSTGEAVTVERGDIIIATPDLKWIVIACGSAEVAKSLSSGISADMTGGISGTATRANAGESIQLNVDAINTDYLKNGTKVLIIDGGTASTNP